MYDDGKKLIAEQSLHNIRAGIIELYLLIDAENDKIRLAQLEKLKTELEDAAIHLANDLSAHDVNSSVA